MRLSPDIIQRVAGALDEEEVDVYTLTLFSLNSRDIDYFEEKDREEVKKIFKVLLDDTKHHSELLRLIVEMGSGQ